MKEILSPCGKYKILVDDQDYDHLLTMRWGIAGKSSNCQYAFTSAGKGRSLSMHRYLLGLKPYDPLRVDHKDGNGLNNQRSNIRIATQAQNGMNKPAHRWHPTGIKGVLLTGDPAKPYIVKISKKRIGKFADLPSAMMAYNDAARIAHGEFAWQHDLMPTLVAVHENRLRILLENKVATK